jgi:hypothetical protein
MTSLPSDAPRPRLCLIKKRHPEEEYGFNLHAEKSKGQFIGAVDAGSPADIAGLRPGDRIVSVNGFSVVNENHKQVVGKIKENSLSCELIVVDEESQSWYNDHKIPVPTDLDFAEIATGKLSEKEEETPEMHVVSSHPSPPTSFESNYAHHVSSNQAPMPPSYQEALADNGTTSPPFRARLCKLIKPDSSAEFGFNLHAEKNSGHFIGKIDAESIAEYAGLEEGQRIVGVNGVLIYPHTAHKDVVSFIKANPLRTELLVASPEVDSWYKTNAEEYDFSASEHFVPLEPLEHGAIGKGVAQLNISNGYSANGDNGFTNGDRSTHTPMKEMQNSHVESVRPVEEPPRFNSTNYQEHSPVYVRSQPPPPVEPYESIRDTAPPVHNQSRSQQPDWMTLSAAQLRERVGQQKKQDPRTKPLSLQQKHEFIRNM